MSHAPSGERAPAVDIGQTNPANHQDESQSERERYLGEGTHVASNSDVYDRSVPLQRDETVVSGVDDIGSPALLRVGVVYSEYWPKAKDTLQAASATYATRRSSLAGLGLGRRKAARRRHLRRRAHEARLLRARHGVGRVLAPGGVERERRV